ncbi:NAD(P)/FAD-dependent oxidoreductase [Nitrogeniibacter aestuarii]|uniref:NAD(P)/FAD-dependent oxidoreductase n=1 Tax=Nitrogeniibacter aestuarii TaxID=2815343 RepID=UPI001E2F7359|nr:FAD-dependent oxidoreductase [Nitrogeniibacter aestuarii]
MTQRKRIVIVGSGLAGMTLVREIRKRDKSLEMLLVCADDGHFYSKPGLSTAFASGKDATGLVLTRAAKLEQDLSIVILAGRRVLGIDASSRTLALDGCKLDYDELVLAVGASQMRLPLAGNGVADVISVNTLDEYARLRQRLDGKRRVAIVGAGLIGCEFANDLCLGGFQVSLYDMAEQPLERLLPPFAARSMAERLTAAGVDLHMATQLAAIEHVGEGYRLSTASGDVAEFDLVISAIGLVPNLELARSAGIKTHRGIVADAFLGTSDPHIHALGDCVEADGQVLPYVMPIMQQAKTLAGTLTGHAEALVYPVMPIVVKTPACPTVICPPPSGVPGTWQVDASDPGSADLRALYLGPDGALAGFVLQGAMTRERQMLVTRIQSGVPTPATA